MKRLGLILQLMRVLLGLQLHKEVLHRLKTQRLAISNIERHQRRIEQQYPHGGPPANKEAAYHLSVQMDTINRVSERAAQEYLEILSEMQSVTSRIGRSWVPVMRYWLSRKRHKDLIKRLDGQISLASILGRVVPMTVTKEQIDGLASCSSLASSGRSSLEKDEKRHSDEHDEQQLFTSCKLDFGAWMCEYTDRNVHMSPFAPPQ